MYSKLCWHSRKSLFELWEVRGQLHVDWLEWGPQFPGMSNWWHKDVAGDWGSGYTNHTILTAPTGQADKSKIIYIVTEWIWLTSLFYTRSPLLLSMPIIYPVTVYISNSHILRLKSIIALICITEQMGVKKRF